MIQKCRITFSLDPLYSGLPLYLQSVVHIQGNCISSDAELEHLNSLQNRYENTGILTLTCACWP
jgi:hypothetical protein